jgi:hypothetical protein
MTDMRPTRVTADARHAVDRVLPWLVAGTAAAVILIEIVLTRLFSVLLYYHYSFLAVALALFGLAAGGVSASRLRIADMSSVVLHIRELLRRAAIALLGLVLLLVLASPGGESISVAVGGAMVSAVPLFLLGKALAIAMALGRARIHRLYAIDLATSAAAALLAIPLLARVQGPLVLAVPALLAIALDAILSPPGRRILPAACAFVLGAALAFAATRAGPLLPLRDPWVGKYVLERWNAHSRVRVSDWAPDQRVLVIDKTAASLIPHVPSGQTQSSLREMSRAYEDPSYLLGRSPQRVAIIGVGGGPDILQALAAGATRIDGFELNGRIVELLQDGLDGYTTLARRPEVHLIHDEARHALQHRQEQYDVIRANLIDTWAATAAGGFVLAENGIYTVEAWRLFLTRLTPSGVLVTTRWYLPAAPAEAQRLVALAAEALEAEGRRADQHLVAIALPAGLEDPLAGGLVQTITTMVSLHAFSNQEVSVLKDFAEKRGGKLLVWPGQPPTEATSWTAMLSPSSRQAFVNASAWAIEPPTDERPFFFLQIRPTDVLRFHGADFGFVSAITVNGVRILLIAVLLAAAVAVVLTAIAIRGRSGHGVRLPAHGRVYFALLGVGYMAIQLALLQRLSLIIGHPTTTLALVVATMLAGTGLGSALAGVQRLRAVPGWILAVPPVALGTLMIGFGHFGDLSRLSSLTVSAVACGGVAGLTGVALGVAFPTGIRLFAHSDVAVTEAWALNGAFSVLGSVAGALGGLLLGSRGLVAAAIPCYVLAWLVVLLGARWPLWLAAGEQAPLTELEVKGA